MKKKNKKKMEKKKKNRWARMVGDEDDNFIPKFRENTRHMGSPIKITPLNNGETYRVKIKAVTLSGMKETEFSEYVTCEGAPPMPKIVRVTPLESSVDLEFECDDYAKHDCKASYEIETFPQTTKIKYNPPPMIPSINAENNNSNNNSNQTDPYIVRINKLNNGWDYRFAMRSINKWGRSKWCEKSNPKTPLKIPPEPTEVQAVPFQKEITVYWASEELNTQEYSGWYVISWHKILCLFFFCFMRVF